MTEATQTTVDPSGVGRTTDGTIQDGQTTQVDQSTTTTSPDSTGKDQTQTDGKTLLTEGKQPEKKEEGEKKPETKSTAPEKYEDYKLPEGLTLSPEVKAKADTLFKGLGLDQAQAQSLVDFYGEQITSLSKAPYEAYQKLTSDWRKEAESHPDLRGKLGPGQEINVRIARALDSLGDPKLASDFRAAMDLTGAGNNPAFIRVMAALAQKVTEGTHVAGNGPTKASQSAPGSAPPSAAAALWPTLPSATRQ